MTRTIDVHHHILPDFFFRETNDAHNPVGGIAPPPWDAQQMLSFMDCFYIIAIITLIAAPVVLLTRKFRLGGGAPAGH